MKIGILGTGAVGKTIGNRLLELGHEVCMGSRTINNEKAQDWVKNGGKNASNGTFADAANFGNMVFNCTKGEIALSVIKSVSMEMENKILIDVSNPLDFSHGTPPSLIPELSNTNSLGEEIQRQFPAIKVIKTLNTMWCGLMVNPMLIQNGNHTNFICGNDQAAKELTIDLLKEFGWNPAQIIDLGDITSARGTEAVLPVWLRIYGVRKSGVFNFNIVDEK